MIDVRIFGLAMTLLLLATIVRMVRRRRLRAKYSFLWLMVGSVVVVLAAVPGLISWMSTAVGIYYPPAFLFLCAIMLLIFVVVHFSWELSRLEDRGRIVAEELAIAIERIDRLEQSASASLVAEEAPGRQLMESRRALMVDERPRVTVVMAVFNRVGDVGGALDSVREQTYPDLELVVVDGASTDGTSELLRARAGDIDHLVIEPDHGIYDAWNKGLARATGDWILFLGSDDRYAAPDAVERLMRGLSSTTAAVNLLTGRCRLVHEHGRPGPRIGSAWNERRMSMWMTFAHPSSATRRTLLEQHGGFSLDVGIAADYDFYLRARHDVRAHDVLEDITLFSAAGVSNANRLATLRSTRLAQARDSRIGPRRARLQYMGFHLALPFRTAARKARARFVQQAGPPAHDVQPSQYPAPR